MDSTPVSEVYLMDCLAGMKRYPDKFFELAIVDPPYGLGMANRMLIGNSKKPKPNPKWPKPKIGTVHVPKKWDTETPKQDYFSELFRVSKHQIIWGGNFFIEYLKNTPSVIAWDKKVNGCFADFEMAWTSHDKAAKIFEFAWNGFRQGDMKSKQTRIHPTQKPIQLYEWLLRNYAKPGDKILDTHLGSGSSRIAAYKMGFDFVGFEIDPDYFEASIKRFEEAVRMPLFDAPLSGRQLEIGLRV